MRPARGPALADDDAIADIFGEVLMIGIVIAVVATIAIVVLPQDTQTVQTGDVHGLLHCGAGNWTTGDETLYLTLLQGENLKTDQFTVDVTVNGTTTSFSQGALGPAAADGVITLGERMQLTINASSTADVRYRIYHEGNDGISIWKERYVDDQACPGTALRGELNPPDQPAFAFHDVDGDCEYTEGTDDPVDAADVLDGDHAAPGGQGLVIPADVGAVDVDGAVSFSSGGGCLAIYVDIDAGSGPVTLDSNGGDMSLDGVTVTGNGLFLFDTDGGDLTASDTAIDAAGARLRVRTDGGALAAPSVVLTAANEIDIQTAGGEIDIQGASLTSTGAYILVDGGTAGSQQSDIQAQDATFHTDDDIDIRSRGAIHLERAVVTSDNGEITIDAGHKNETIYVEDAEFRDDDDEAHAEPKNVNIDGTPAFGAISD